MKLEGIRVLDLSAFVPGPYLSLAMVDHGDEVIKIEPPGGEHGRHIGQSIGGTTVFFRNLNRGKKSVVLDLKTQAGLEALLALADTADVFIESFRPGVVARLGVDARTLRARNPRLVYCSISAFGQHGPQAARAAHDLATEAMAGVMSISVGRDGEPATPALPWADLLAGMQGLSAVLMALLRRQTTGLGDTIDISMQDAIVGASLNVLGPAIAEGRQQVAAHERTTGGSALYRMYRTADGRFLALAEWLGWMEGRDICHGPVVTFPEMLRDPHLHARGMILTEADGSQHIGPPIAFADEFAHPVLHAPALGEHTQVLLQNFKPKQEA